jgi:hypothetical protein
VCYSHTVSRLRHFVFAVVVLSGCSLDATFDGSRYRCELPVGQCPDGYRCSSEGLCELPPPPPKIDASIDDPDASIDDPDAEVSPPDATHPDASHPDAMPPPPPPPDAAPPPDAEVPTTSRTFGAARDTQLFSPQPGNNFGNWAEIKCASKSSPFVDSPVLFGFDTSSIPRDATVVSASMRLTVSGNPLESGQVSVYALREDWEEGFQDGTPGVANYVERLPGVDWSTQGAKPPSRGSSPVASFSAGQTFSSVDFALPRALVQSWVDNPDDNFGVILTCPSNTDVTFFTRAGGVSSQRPRLTVTYTQ